MPHEPCLSFLSSIFSMRSVPSSKERTAATPGSTKRLAQAHRSDGPTRSAPGRLSAAQPGIDADGTRRNARAFERRLPDPQILPISRARHDSCIGHGITLRPKLIPANLTSGTIEAFFRIGLLGRVPLPEPLRSLHPTPARVAGRRIAHVCSLNVHLLRR